MVALTLFKRVAPALLVLSLAPWQTAQAGMRGGPGQHVGIIELHAAGRKPAANSERASDPRFIRCGSKPSPSLSKGLSAICAAARNLEATHRTISPSLLRSSASHLAP